MQFMNTPTSEIPGIRAHDYGRELKNAVSWLGDRYLLAAPQPRRADERPRYWTAAQHSAAHWSRPARR